MDVLIKNMTLPTEDEQVNITILSDGSVIEHFRNESGKWSSYRSGGVKAIELASHGRLVDADVIRELLTKDCPCKGCDNYHEEGICMQCQWDRFVQIIQQAPTVLEATE